METLILECVRMLPLLAVYLIARREWKQKCEELEERLEKLERREG